MARPDLFDSVVQDILAAEGGYSNDPRDPGGETNFGLSKRANPDLDIKNLTREQAIARYKERYWTPYGLDALPDAWAHFLFDCYVQHGNTAQVQEWRKMNNVIDALWMRVRFYTHLSNFITYGAGWIRRMANLRDRLLQLYGVR